MWVTPLGPPPVPLSARAPDYKVVGRPLAPEVCQRQHLIRHPHVQHCTCRFWTKDTRRVIARVWCRLFLPALFRLALREARAHGTSLGRLCARPTDRAAHHIRVFGVSLPSHAQYVIRSPSGPLRTPRIQPSSKRLQRLAQGLPPTESVVMAPLSRRDRRSLPGRLRTLRSHAEQQATATYGRNVGGS